MEKTFFSPTEIPDSPFSKWLFADTRIGVLWLALRLYVGWEWIQSGWIKIHSPFWIGTHAGKALQGFLQGALHKTGGVNPDVSGWYAAFLHGVVIPHVAIFSFLVAYGELAVGIGLMLGIFTGIAAFFGAFMNMNYLFAGTVSINPLFFLFELFLMLAWRVAGWYGLDRFLLPLLGTPWKPGHIFQKQP